MPLPVHRAVEFATGVVVALGPLALAAADVTRIAPAAIILAGLLGFALISLGVATTREGNALAARSHAALDRVLIAVLLVAGVAFAFAGDGVVGALCVGAGAVLTVVSLVTRYDDGADDISAGTTTTTTG